MIINQVSSVTDSEVESLTWLRLRRFQNVSYVTAFLIELHHIPASHKASARKQAEQIRFCLIQAEEYFIAARSVSLATKPLLIYYGIMSFALAEILVKQSGDSSLDRARSEHAHHGLILKESQDPSKFDDLKISADSLVAAPMINGSTRQGTFELWHRSSREGPVIGKRVTTYPANTEENTVLMLVPIDERPSLVPLAGRSLLSVFRSLPGMEQTLRQAGIKPNFIRAKGTTTHDVATKTSISTIVIHPNEPEVLEEVLNLFTFSPNCLPNVTVDELARGYSVHFTEGPDNPMGNSSFPPAFQSRASTIRFSTEDSLTEFGLIYMATYILGNYARYYPDQWMRDVEGASALSLAASTLVEIALHRAPFLTMCELSRVWYVLE